MTWTGAGSRVTPGIRETSAPTRSRTAAWQTPCVPHLAGRTSGGRCRRRAAREGGPVPSRYLRTAPGRGLLALAFDQDFAAAGFVEVRLDADHGTAVR